MLLKEIKENHEYGIFKSVAEIILDEELNDKGVLSKKLNESKFNEHPKEVISKFLRENGYEDYNNFWSKICKRIILRGVKSICCDYCNTFSTRASLKHAVNEKFNRSRVDDSVMDEIIIHFKKYFMSNSAGSFQWSTGSCRPFIPVSFSFFLDSPIGMTIVKKIVNERGTLTGEGSNGEMLSLSDTLEIRNEEYSQIFDFTKRVKEIYEGSLEMFTTDARHRVSMYQDLVNMYIIIKDEQNSIKLNTQVRNKFYAGSSKDKKTSLLSNGLYLPQLKILDPNSDTSHEYRRLSYLLRKDICRSIIEVLDEGLDGSKIDLLFNKTVRLNTEKSNNKNLSLVYSKSDRPTKMDKAVFMKILHGLLGAKLLVGYCISKGINYRNFPSDIFRKPLYYSRFESIEDCLESFDKTSEQISKAGNEHVIGLLNADDLYKKLNDDSSKCSPLADYNFKSIKNLIEQSEGKAESFNLNTRRLLLNQERINIKWVLNKMYSSLVEKKGSLYNCTTDDFSDYYSELDEIIGVNTFIYIINSQYYGHDLVLNVFRACNLKYSLICQLCQIYEIQKSLEEYSLLEDISNGKVKLFPNSVTDLGDLLNLGSKEIDDKIDFSTKPPREFEEWRSKKTSEASSELNPLLKTSFDYSLSYLYEAFKSGYSLNGEYLESPLKHDIEVCNDFLKTYINYSESVGITTGHCRVFSDELTKASLVCYDKEPVMTVEFNRFKAHCVVENDYLYRNGKPHFVGGFYLHETGWLVTSDGSVKKPVTPGSLNL